MDIDFLGAQNITTIIVYGILIFFIVSIICSGSMLFTLIKKGDERKKHILSKSFAQTLLIYIGVLLVDVLYTILIESKGGFYIENASLLSLGIISIIFTISLFFNKRKYGN